MKTAITTKRIKKEKQPILQPARVTALFASNPLEAARSQGGIFYTPPSLTNRLISVAEAAGVDWATARDRPGLWRRGPFWLRWRLKSLPL